MSFYRTILAAVAAIAIAAPAFADDTTTNATQQNTTGQAATQTNDNSGSAATQQTASNSDQSTTAATDTKINLNKATAKDLAKIKGLSMAKAKAIVAYRKKHGNFTSPTDIANVKGFKKMNQDNMKTITDQLTVE